jgi:hypothetical protein
MKLAACVFFLLRSYSHEVGDADDLFVRPLSEFRDGKHAGLGYVLFAVLLFIGLLHAVTLARARKPLETAVSSVAFTLLLVVAVTPSYDSTHIACSLFLLLLLFGYYALLLYLLESLWLIAHLAVPTTLALVTQFQGYGIWQKSFIVYFVIVAMVHHHLLRRLSAADPPSPVEGRRRKRRDPLDKRRKVYQLEQCRTWTRGG